MSHRVCLLPGDGIGPEVIAQAEKVLRALDARFEFEYADIGYEAYKKHGTPLPQATLDSILRSDAALFGAVTTPPDIPGYFSPVVRMRRSLDLYANVRPCRSFDHPASHTGIDLVIIRENTEDLYSGVERTEDNGNRAISEMIITRHASERISRKAFELARAEGRHKVTVVHKANVLRETCGLFRRTALDVAEDYPEIEVREMLVDTCAMELVRAPGQFDVIVTTNMFGDILSDEASMLVGGLGVAYSGNFGSQVAVFEPVHGSAPDIAGRHSANPIATFLSAVMLLNHIGEASSAFRLRQAVMDSITRQMVTVDMGGTCTTEQVTDQILAALEINFERK